MIAYLIKTILCSALLYGYYHVALRNKIFHQWNRFYLLAIVPLSLLLPLIRIRLNSAAEEIGAGPVRLLEVVSDSNERMEAVVLTHPQQFDWSVIIYGAYGLVAAVLLTRFLRGILRLRRLAASYPVHSAEGVDLVLAPIKGTPFTFFRRIFWNPALDPATDHGRQILQHELVHVREQHSVDKLLLQATLALCWFNPVFWILRNEVHLVHEFIADKRSMKNHDASVLAQLILHAAYPQEYNRLANPFFHHAVKRRLHMLNQMSSAPVRYFGRVLALPLLAGIGFAFAVRTQNPPAVAGGKTGERFVVVIDPGHGRVPTGEWNGAQYKNVSEDEITLAIARKVKELNADPRLQIVLTRNNEQNVDLHRRVAISSEAGANLFISLHVNAMSAAASKEIPRKGFSIDVATDSGSRSGSRMLGSLLQQSLSNVYRTDPRLYTRPSGVWVLKQASCPAALAELGYIDKDADRAFITKPEHHERIAIEILNAVARYREGVVRKR